MIRVVHNVVLEPCIVLELGDAVYLCQLQPILDVEFEVELVGDIAHLVVETGKEFDVLLLETP